MKLLISVRNAEEALIAAECGVDIIDLKEPANGPLGCASPATVAEFSSAMALRDLQTSVAAGELIASPPSLPGSSDAAVHYVKCGTSGYADRGGWSGAFRTDWQRWADRVVKQQAVPVPVFYADAESCRGLPPETIAANASSLGTEMVLIDTWEKRGGLTLLDCLSRQRLALIATALRELNVGLALAGSLSKDDIPLLSDVGAEVVGFRGAACIGRDRHQRLDTGQVEALVSAFRG